MSTCHSQSNTLMYVRLEGMLVVLLYVQSVRTSLTRLVTGSGRLPADRDLAQQPVL